MYLYNIIFDFIYIFYKIDIVYVNDVVEVNYLYNIFNLGENMCIILFFFKLNVNCYLLVLIILRILIYINDSYDVLIWSDI